MIKIRKSEDRGKGSFDWLTTYHSFSFADYYNPDHMGFQSLRVINDDIIAPGGGFDTHGHRDMEIVTYVIEGTLAHKDSIGNIATIKTGEVQRMTAGKGIRHSEFNHSDKQQVRLLQIWILPEKNGLEPGYEQKNFSQKEKQGKLKLIVSPEGRDGSLKIHQNAEIYASVLEKDDKISYVIPENSHVWIQIASGCIEVNGNLLENGDGAAISDEKDLKISSKEDSEFLLFRL